MKLDHVGSRENPQSARGVLEVVKHKVSKSQRSFDM